MMLDDLRGRHDAVDLSANENPLGPPPAVFRAITANAGLVHRYPDSQGASLKAALARKLGVEVGNVVLGNGSAEISDLLARALFGDGGEAVIGWPSSPTHRAAVERAGGEVIHGPLVQHAYDLDAIAARVGPRTRLVMIGNPNNPTGLALSKAALDRFLSRLPHGPVVCLDETYAEYATKPDFPNSVDYIGAGHSLLAVRSLSKAYGLAGLRMGYAIAPEGLALRLNDQRQRFNTSSLAQIAALAALGDPDHLASAIALNAKGREWLATRLSLLGLFFLPSEANFLLVRVGDGARVCNDLRQNGVLVKELDAFGLPEYIRVSVGSPGENARFIACLQRAMRA
jgi:histidinol-phosphate aminotransferase